MELAYYLEACTDCVCFVANGDIPDDRPNLADTIDSNLGAEDAKNLVNADECDPETGHSYEPWFSQSGCECCGQQLGGMRQRLAVLQCEES